MWEEVICGNCHGAGCPQCDWQGVVYENEDGDCVSPKEREFLEYLDWMDNERKRRLEDAHLY